MSGSPVTEPAPAGSAPGRRLALVVAVTDYLDTSLRRLRAPAGDAADLRDLLADPEIGDFTVTSVVNERAHQLRVAIEDFLADRHPDDLLLVYLSCHGLMDARRRLYFAARDTLKHRLAASGVEAHWLLEQLEDCRARRQVVILDCCFSGAFARGAKGDDDLGLGDRLVGEGRGRVVLTASRGTEYSFEGEPLQGEDSARGSVFTTALIEGIRTGRADTDDDGDVSVEDAYAYAFEQVRQTGSAQTPQRWLYGAEGSILLARTPAHEPPPPPPPPGPPPTDPEEDERPVPDDGDGREQAVDPEDGSTWFGVRTRWVLGGLVVFLAALLAVFVFLWQSGPEDTSASEDGAEADLPTSEPLTDTQFLVTVFHPDGSKEIRLVDESDQANNRQVKFDASGPSLSPDRRTVVYSVGLPDERNEQWVAGAADGAGERALFSRPPDECSTRTGRPAWVTGSPTRLVVWCLDANNQGRLLLVDLDGTVQRTFAVPGPDGQDLSYIGDPTASPDGKTVVVWGNSVQATSGRLYAIEVASGKSHPVTPDFAPTYTDAAFSPDGQRLAYRKDLGDGTHAIFTADFSAADTPLEDVRLTEYDHDSDPSWSPDGSRIAFSRTTPDGINRLFIVNAEDGTPAEEVVGQPPRDPGVPAWTHR